MSDRRNLKKPSYHDLVREIAASLSLPLKNRAQQKYTAAELEEEIRRHCEATAETAKEAEVAVGRLEALQSEAEAN